MALGLIAEALARIEHKLDLLLDYVGAGTKIFNPMHFIGHQCPVCKQAVEYQVNVTKNVVNRRCGCTTGKTPMAIPLTPVDINGELHGNTVGNGSEPTTEEGSSTGKRTRR